MRKSETCEKIEQCEKVRCVRISKNKLSPAQSKLREVQFSYSKAQGQHSLDLLREAQLSNLSLT